MKTTDFTYRDKNTSYNERRCIYGTRKESNKAN